jgi:6-phospho-beta-glucosidase
VVEVSCRVDRDGIVPLPAGDIPAGSLALMQAVKTYERLTVRAIETRSRKIAVEALMCHPLVLSYPRSRALVDDYVAAHQADLT